MKWIVMVAVLITMIGCRGTAKINTTHIEAGMTKQEVIEKLGAPDSVGVKDGHNQLYYTIHDHAFDNDKNTYVFVFEEDKLIEFYPAFNTKTESKTTVIPIHKGK